MSNTSGELKVKKTWWDFIIKRGKKKEKIIKNEGKKINKNEEKIKNKNEEKKKMFDVDCEVIQLEFSELRVMRRKQGRRLFCSGTFSTEHIHFLFIYFIYINVFYLFIFFSLSNPWVCSYVHWLSEFSPWFRGTHESNNNLKLSWCDFRITVDDIIQPRE